MICQQLSTAPVILNICCKQVLGCNACVSTWLNTHDTCLHCRSDGAQEKIFSFTVFDNVLGLMWTFSAREFWWTDENIFHTQILSKWKKCRGCYPHAFILMSLDSFIERFCNVNTYVYKHIIWSTFYWEQKSSFCVID